MKETFRWIPFKVLELSTEEFEEYVQEHKNILIYHTPSKKIFHYISTNYSGNSPSTLIIQVQNNLGTDIYFDFNNCRIAE